jgi:hypothetical protein
VEVLRRDGARSPFGVSFLRRANAPFWLTSSPRILFFSSAFCSQGPSLAVARVARLFKLANAAGLQPKERSD